MIDKIIYWSFDNPAELGVQASSAVGSRPLNVPMIVLDTLEQLYRADTSQTINYMPVSRKCARMILQHNVKVLFIIVLHFRLVLCYCSIV